MNLIILTLLSVSASANSMATFQGKLVSLTEKDVAIQKNKTTYFIRKSEISASELKAATKIGSVVTIHAPLDALDATKIQK